MMHPGPINRGVEIAHDLADRRPSVILDQVRNGVAVRMAVLYLLAGRRRERGQRRSDVVSRILIRGGRLLDPGDAAATSSARRAASRTAGSRRCGAGLAASGREVIDARGLLGRARLRRSARAPARARARSTRKTSRRAAAPAVAGGFTTVVLHGEHGPGERRPGGDGVHPRPRARGLAGPRAADRRGDAGPRGRGDDRDGRAPAARAPSPSPTTARRSWTAA